MQSKKIILFDNEYCKIYEVKGRWIRYDKILKTKMFVNSYSDKTGKLIRR